MRAPRRFRPWLPVLLALGACAGSAHAVDYKSVGPGPAVMVDAPAAKARKLFVAPPGMPVEVVVTSGDWSRVRDAAGDLAWVENKALTDRRMLVVEAAQATARSAANDGAPVVFTAARGVLLEVAEPIASGWIKVRHRDGDIGYVKAADVWGE
ncbi:MAG: SH3 domain-containing protein [Burkholderiaceae bacterium]|nr:SH3 domain-containing protein [Burkholderiaceae bacterium]